MIFIALLKNKLKFLFICSAILICNTTVYVEATPVKFIIEGYLDYVPTELSGTFSTRDLYHLEYTVESTSVDWYPDDPGKASYVDAITSLTITIGDYYSAAGTGESLITLYDNHSTYADWYRISLPAESMTGDDVNGCYLYRQSALLSFGDAGGNAFSDDGIIPDTLDYSNFSGYMGLTFYDPSMSDMIWYISISANISSFEYYPVPVPSALLLLSSGLLGLFGISRIKK